MGIQHIKRLEASASEFFVSEALATRLLAVHGGSEHDIDGALEAGQYGMAFVASRAALHTALFIHLAREGRVGALPADLRDVGSQVFELLAAHDHEGHVWKQAWAIECTNPATASEVASYAERYRRLLSDVLQLDTLSPYNTLLSDSGYGAYLELAEELAHVFEHLGIQGINLPDARARMERRALVNSRLRDDGAAGGDRAESDDAHRESDHPMASGDACIAARIALTDDEVRLLGSLLRAHVSELQREMSRTDGRDARRDLLVRQELCERLIAQLGAAAPAHS